MKCVSCWREAKWVHLDGTVPHCSIHHNLSSPLGKGCLPIKEEKKREWLRSSGVEKKDCLILYGSSLAVGGAYMTEEEARKLISVPPFSPGRVLIVRVVAEGMIVQPPMKVEWTS